jgi:hypothetical protein
MNVHSLEQDDTATLNELEDNRINRILSLELVSSGKCMDPCIPQLNLEPEKLIMEKSEKIVMRTPKKSINESNRHLKRVSFHEECFSQTDFSVSFVAPGTAILKKDTVKGRYSWCAGGDAPFVVCDTEPKTNSLCLLQSECAEERGVPEGQEDNQTYNEHPILKKADVLKLRKLQLLKKLKKPKPILYWPNLQPNPQACQQLLQELEYEIACNKIKYADDLPFSGTTLKTLKTKIFFNITEDVYKVRNKFSHLYWFQLRIIIYLLNLYIFC